GKSSNRRKAGCCSFTHVAVNGDQQPPYVGCYDNGGGKSAASPSRLLFLERELNQVMRGARHSAGQLWKAIRSSTSAMFPALGRGSQLKPDCRKIHSI